MTHIVCRHKTIIRHRINYSVALFASGKGQSYVATLATRISQSHGHTHTVTVH